MAALAVLALLAGAMRAGAAPPDTGLAAVAGVAEPPGYRTERYRAPTPTTLKGATVVGDEEAMRLWRMGVVVFVDVMPRPEKPANLPEGTLWRPAKRWSIPGSAWLANVGYGVLSPETEAYFRAGLAALTGADASKPLLFYCLADCWMSWNAAKRALAEGYRQVYWYPEGTDGWTRAGGALAESEPFTVRQPAGAPPILSRGAP